MNSQIWIAHVSMMIRCISLAVISFLYTRVKLLDYNGDGHDVLDNDNMGVWLISCVECFCALVTGCAMTRYVINNIKLKCCLLSFLIILLSTQCFLLIDIISKTNETRHRGGVTHEIFTASVCGLGIFAFTTALQLGLYLYTLICSAVRRCKSEKQGSYMYQNMSNVDVPSLATDKNNISKNSYTV